MLLLGLYEDNSLLSYLMLWLLPAFKTVTGEPVTSWFQRAFAEVPFLFENTWPNKICKCKFWQLYVQVIVFKTYVYSCFWVHKGFPVSNLQHFMLFERQYINPMNLKAKKSVRMEGLTWDTLCNGYFSMHRLLQRQDLPVPWFEELLLVPSVWTC